LFDTVKFGGENAGSTWEGPEAVGVGFRD
jgi:hypothetical protein